jgi:hypothetical protein
MRKALVLAGFLVFGFAPSANAVPVEVQYSVVSTATVLAIPIANLTGTATIRYQNATAAGNDILNGAVRFQSFNASGPVFFSIAGLVLNGNLTISFGPMGGNPGNSAFAQAFPSAGMSININGIANVGNLHCSGTVAQCSAVFNPTVVGGLPVSATVFNIPFGIGAANLANLNTAGGQGNPDLNSTITLNNPSIATAVGLPVAINNTLTEISRTVVPEPGTASLLWLGLIGIGGARWHRRQQRRR